MTDPGLDIEIRTYSDADQPAIRAILTAIGWAERYIAAFEDAAATLARRADAAVYLARRSSETVGFIFVELHGWNRLAQIQGLAVAPAAQRQGVASALVAQAEAVCARARRARHLCRHAGG